MPIEPEELSQEELVEKAFGQSGVLIHRISCIGTDELEKLTKQELILLLAVWVQITDKLDELGLA